MTLDLVVGLIHFILGCLLFFRAERAASKLEEGWTRVLKRQADLKGAARVAFRLGGVLFIVAGLARAFGVM
jgi:hypothetical protein